MYEHAYENPEEFIDNKDYRSGEVGIEPEGEDGKYSDAQRNEAGQIAESIQRDFDVQEIVDKTKYGKFERGGWIEEMELEKYVDVEKLSRDIIEGEDGVASNYFFSMLEDMYE